MNIVRSIMRQPGAVWTALRLGGAALALALVMSVAAPQSAFAQDTAAPAAAEATAAAPAAEAAPAPAAEAAAPAPTPDKGDTTWMLISTALVLVMTIPGLALFYGGLVRSKNMLSVLSQVSIVSAIGMVIWALWGYSLAFTSGPDGLNAFIGGTSRFFLAGAGPGTNVETFSVGVVIPELTFFVFQMTFAAITAALVLGGIAERVKLLGVVIFAIAWPTLVYYPIAHMVWWWAGATSGAGQSADDLVKGAGLLWGFGAIDFAGGTVVHINSGIAALMGALVVGRRVGYKKENMPPHNLPLVLTGTGLLWFGWFGFNAGSNLESNGYAALAMTNTFLAPAAAGLSWALVEAIHRQKPSMLGVASGIVAGLVVVTPMAGFAGPMGAIVSGLLVSPICYLFVAGVKNVLGYDDTLDVFGVHCIGGITGAILTGIVVDPSLGGQGIVDYSTCDAAGVCQSVYPGLVAQVTSQLKAVVVTLVWSGVGSLVIFLVLKILGLLRISQEKEVEGLDLVTHGEQAYHN